MQAFYSRQRTPRRPLLQKNVGVPGEVPEPGEQRVLLSINMVRVCVWRGLLRSRAFGSVLSSV